MNCREAKQLISPYLDGMLESKRLSRCSCIWMHASIAATTTGSGPVIPYVAFYGQGYTTGSSRLEKCGDAGGTTRSRRLWASRALAGLDAEKPEKGYTRCSRSRIAVVHRLKRVHIR